MSNALENLIQDTKVDGFYDDESIQKWYFEFVHSFTIHDAGQVPASKRISDPGIHTCIFDLVSYKDDVFVMLNYLNNYKVWGLRAQQKVVNKSRKIHHTCVGR